MVLLLPECDALFSSTETVWLCTRSISLGCACLFTLVVSVYACQRIAPIFASTGWYSTNLTMLLLTALQMALLVFECFILNNPKVLVVTKYCRALQVAVSCLLYGKLACDMMNRSELYYQLLAPVVSVTMLVMSLDSAAVVLFADEVDCHHLSWLMSSMASVILSVSFAIPGRIVLEEIKTASRMQQKYLAVVSTAVAELEQSHLQLWTLLVCNVVSTTFQLMVDLYVTYGVSGPHSCNSLFFKDGSGALEQFFRFVVSLVSYLLPNWATIYVFYLLPRFQFSTTLDVPDIELDDSYELLLAREDGDDTTEPHSRQMPFRAATTEL